MSSTLTALLRERARTEPDHVPLVVIPDDPEEPATGLSNAQIDTRAREVAGLLRENLSPGDRALLEAPGVQEGTA
jgi:acyl-CoA synthetase (AMP-forming)/AMP-acid ligase II